MSRSFGGFIAKGSPLTHVADVPRSEREAEQRLLRLEVCVCAWKRLDNVKKLS